MFVYVKYYYFGAILPKVKLTVIVGHGVKRWGFLSVEKGFIGDVINGRGNL